MGEIVTLEEHFENFTDVATDIADNFLGIGKKSTGAQSFKKGSKK